MRRIRGERARQRDALALTARKFVRAALLVAVQLHEVEQFAYASAHRRRRPLAHGEREADVLRHGLMRKERVVLKDEADVALAERQIRHVAVVEVHAAGIDRLEARDRSQ